MRPFNRLFNVFPGESYSLVRVFCWWIGLENKIAGKCHRFVTGENKREKTDDWGEVWENERGMRQNIPSSLRCIRSKKILKKWWHMDRNLIMRNDLNGGVKIIKIDQWHNLCRTICDYENTWWRRPLKMKVAPFFVYIEKMSYI